MSKTHNPGKEILIPHSIASFVGVCPRLLPGESEKNYYELFDTMTDEIAPTTNLEWFALADIVDLLWDIGRYRLWKNVILAVSRQGALETALLQTHPSIAPKNLPMRITISRQEAEEWRTKPEKRAVLEASFAERGYDADALNAGALMEALVPLATIDRFLCSARGQLNATLKEIGARREFAERARKAFNERVVAEVAAPARLQIEAKQ